jgi:hypothetical protein
VSSHGHVIAFDLVNTKSIVLLVLLCLAPAAQAGMSAPRLTDVAGARLDSISFFLAIYVLCAVLFRWVWNMLARDFAWMPRLTFKKSLALLVVAGLFMYFILTMISGARELLTPGAWARNGAGYQLTSPEDKTKAMLDTARMGAMARLRDALRDYAAKHDGKLPPHPFAADFDTSLWKGIDPSGTWLAYMPGRTFSPPARLIAFEPASYGAKRWVLLSDTSLLLMDSTELDQRVRKEFLP